jgi:hypothetical protein
MRSHHETHKTHEKNAMNGLILVLSGAAGLDGWSALTSTCCLLCTGEKRIGVNAFHLPDAN